jgi:arsenite methyltransferase
VAAQDRWARWVLHSRDADDDRVRRRAAAQLAGYRDGVLDRAAVADGDVLLDVGTGDGLVAFGALDRVGAGGRVVFSDVSADLLAECRRRAAADGVLERCDFVQAGAEDLSGVADGSVDVVTTRSVLIYVARKDRAFAEFFRVLRPGGRLSIFEPINRFAVLAGDGGLLGLDLTQVADLVAKVRGAYRGAPIERDSMLNFDERDLLRWARDAGFAELELDYRAEVGMPEPPPTTDWDVLKATAPNPLAPSLAEALDQTLTDEERRRFEHHARAALAAGTPARTTTARTFLRGVRP